MGRSVGDSAGFPLCLPTWTRPASMTDATAQEVEASSLTLLLHTAFEHAPDGMAFASLDGVLLTANRSLCSMLGLSEPDVLGKSLFELLEPRAAEALKARLSLLQTGAQRTFSRDCQTVGRMGRPLWLGLSVAVMRDAQGQTAGVIVQARDITDSKQVERVLLASDRRFRTIFNALSEGFIETTPDGTVVDLNQPLCRMLGYGREDLVGKQIFFVLDEASRGRMQRALLEPQAGARSYEVTLCRKDGEGIPAQVLSTPLTDDSGALLGMMAIVLDVRERNQALQALRDSEQRNRTLVEALQDGLVMIRDQRFHYVNLPFATMLGYAPGDLIGVPVRRFLLEQTDYLHGLPQGEAELTFVGQDGRQVVALINGGLAQASNQPGGLLIATVRDVTERRRIQAEVRKLSWAVEHSPASVMITDRSGRIEYVNPQFTAVTGYQSEEVLGCLPSILKSEETASDVHQGLWRSLSNGEPWSGEFRNRRKDGSLFWDYTSVAPIRNESGEVTHFVAVKEDITARKEAELRTWRRANFDAVTGLPNRVLFMDRLSQSLTRAQRNGEPVAVMFIDLDHFKAVNDTLGHEAGDAVLRGVARRLEASVRDGDTVARLAGDEFMVILPSPGDEKDVTIVAERILDALRQPFLVDGDKEAYIGGSVGIALYPEDGTDPHALIRSADHAMYRSKDGGRNCYQFFTAEMNRVVEARIQLENDLRRAVQGGEFAVHFRPVFNHHQRSLQAAAVTVQWAHPVQGILPADSFWAVAEEIGVVAELGDLMLRRACVQAAVWRDSGYPFLGVIVPVSSRQLSSSPFMEAVDLALERSGLEASALSLAIPEEVLLKLTPVSEAALMALAARGIRVIVQGFGSGYAGLHQLRRFPFAGVELSDSVVRSIVEDHDGGMIAEAVIAMAHKMGLAVTARIPSRFQGVGALLTTYGDWFEGVVLPDTLSGADFEDVLEARGAPVLPAGL